MFAAVDRDGRRPRSAAELVAVALDQQTVHLRRRRDHDGQSGETWLERGDVVRRLDLAIPSAVAPRHDHGLLELAPGTRQAALLLVAERQVQDVPPAGSSR